ncbi:MAG: polyamine aminopropyltransferase [SAR324 cluster bacterium]|nr:polyamine aminopropyltransferase [SAR324 cluster bacterium]
MRQVTHIISELMHCKANQSLFTQADALLKQLTLAVQDSGLTVVASSVYPFDKGGVTGTLVLAESHLNIHTWPERDFYINLDISVCNYDCDNFAKALKLFESLKKLFAPIDFNHQILEGYKDIEDHKFTEYFSKDYGFFIKPQNVLYRKSDETQEVSVYDTNEFGKLLRIDNFFQTSEKDEFYYHECMTHPALIAHPKPKQVAVIGGGDGGIAKNVFQHSTVEKLVMVEIDNRVVEVSKAWLDQVHGGSFEDPRMNLVIQDGLVWAKETAEKFDVIILDLTDPIGPAKELYTKEFYADIKKLLNPGGIVAQHTEYPAHYPKTFGRINATLADLYANVAHGFCFIPLYGAVMSFAYASDSVKVKEVSLEDIEKRLVERGVTGLKYYNGETHRGLMAEPNYIKEILAGNHDVVTKDNPIHDFSVHYNQSGRR